MSIQSLIITTIFTIYSQFVLSQNTPSFLSIGDWGAAAIGGQHLTNVKTVSEQLYKTYKKEQSEFVLNNGDNFYYCGIQSIDDTQVTTDFKDYFEKTDIPWYNALGNHDYGYNASAQIELSNVIPNWIMDERYYYRKLASNGFTIHTIFLDTNPCDSYFVQSNPKYWDPCGSEFPTCALNGEDDDFEGPCKFHQNILTQNCSAQFVWFQTLIESIQKTKQEKDWIIIVGHHPVYEITEAPFPVLIDRYADLYINGHTHLLNHYSINGGDAKYITTGAAGMVSVGDTDKQHEIVHQDDPLQLQKDSYNIVWSEKVAGFALHRIQNNGSSLVTNFIRYDGSTIYSFTIDK